MRNWFINWERRGRGSRQPCSLRSLSGRPGIGLASLSLSLSPSLTSSLVSRGVCWTREAAAAPSLLLLYFCCCACRCPRHDAHHPYCEFPTVCKYYIFFLKHPPTHNPSGPIILHPRNVFTVNCNLLIFFFFTFLSLGTFFRFVEIFKGCLKLVVNNLAFFLLFIVGSDLGVVVADWSMRGSKVTAHWEGSSAHEWAYHLPLLYDTVLLLYVLCLSLRLCIY